MASGNRSSYSVRFLEPKSGFQHLVVLQNKDIVLFYCHLARNYGDLLTAKYIQPDELEQIFREILVDAGLIRDY